MRLLFVFASLVFAASSGLAQDRPVNKDFQTPVFKAVGTGAEYAAWKNFQRQKAWLSWGDDAPSYIQQPNFNLAQNCGLGRISYRCDQQSSGAAMRLLARSIAQISGKYIAKQPFLNTPFFLGINKLAGHLHH